MKTIIVYYSKTGFTKRYAQWIAEALEGECIPFEKRGEVRLADYDAVLFGSWLHAGSIQKIGWFKKQLRDLRGKKMGVFAVGATPAEATEIVRQTFEKSFNEEERSCVRCFYLQGGLDYDKMGGVDRMMMRMLCKIISSKKQRTPEDDAMQQMISRSFDAADRKYIAPIVHEFHGEN